MAQAGQNTFRLHRLVWDNSYSELDQEIANGSIDLEEKDPRGRTPLHLAVTLGHLECTRVLLRHGANANAENAKTWTVIQEAISTGDPELLQICLQYRDYQRYTRRTEGVPALLEKLKEAPDFYVEMKWEFTSWVPLVSRMCPHDTYKVWKSGQNVRIDTTLLGFDNMNWQRGSRSFVFSGADDSATVMEIDHDNKQVFTEIMRVLPTPPDATTLAPSEDAIAARITAPISTTYIDTEKIAFERNKSGIWGWRNDRTEMVNSYECKVFSASNVELVTKTRVEHLSDCDKKEKKKLNKTPLESFLGIAEQQEKIEAADSAASNGEIDTMTNNPCSIKPDEYFDPGCDLKGRDIGRPIEQTTKVQKFKANIWLAENYPLTLQEQVLPIIDLMAASNAHFKKLRDFITLQLPSGFPVKIEIPLFHVLNARVTFGNIFANETPAEFVKCIKSGGPEQSPLCCVIEDECFSAPNSYSRIGDGYHSRLRDEDDQLLQFAIQQSIIDAGTENDQVTFWEALNRTPESIPVNMQSEEERQLQRALEASLSMSQGDTTVEESQPSDSTETPTLPALDDQLRLVMEMSRREQQELERRQKQEEEELEMILKLSMTEK